MDQNYQLSHFKTGGLDRRQKTSEDCPIFFGTPPKNEHGSLENSLQTERPDVSSAPNYHPFWGSRRSFLDVIVGTLVSHRWFHARSF